MGSCVIPYTEAAIGRLDRYFGVEKGGGAEQLKARKSTVTIQNEDRCEYNEEGICTFQPIVVIAPPKDPPSEGGGNAGGSTGGGGDGMGSGGGGGGTSGWGSDSGPGDDLPPDPRLPNCAAPGNPQEAGWCQGAAPEGAMLERILNALKRLRARGNACAGLADKASYLLSTGGIRVTSYAGGGYSAAAPLAGDWAVFKSDALDSNKTDIWVDYLIAHEMDHSVNNVVTGVTSWDGHILKSDGSVDLYNTLNSQRCKRD